MIESDSLRGVDRPGLMRMFIAAKPGECPFCGDDTAPYSGTGRRPATCGDAECKKAWHRCWQRDARSGKRWCVAFSTDDGGKTWTAEIRGVRATDATQVRAAWRAMNELFALENHAELVRMEKAGGLSKMLANTIFAAATEAKRRKKASA